MHQIKIPFNQPFASGRELEYISRAISNGHLSGNGEFTKKCHAWLESAIGCIGHLAAVSFHETKNVISGEGGALLVNHPEHIERAEIIWEKGTNRNQFFRGLVDKYTWVDIGSSYLPSELNAAFLWAQLEAAEAITQKRLKIWQQYHQALADLEVQGKVRRPIIPDEC
jgi:dTDP-4-amino-4,6-dideoxygalactose transaminase